MLSAVLAVAAVATGVLFAGTRIFGSASGWDGASRAEIGAPAHLMVDADAAQGSAAAGPQQSPGASPLIANQPAPPTPSTQPASPAATKTTDKPKAATVTATVTANAAPEAQVFTLVNTERAKVGCTALTADDRLTAAARGHSTDMATRNYFSHDTPEGVSVGTRVTNTGYKWSMVGENIAWGQATAAAVMTSWMNSAGHKANILNCGYRSLGVGMAYDSNRRPYWTQDFGTLM